MTQLENYVSNDQHTIISISYHHFKCFVHFIYNDLAFNHWRPGRRVLMFQIKTGTCIRRNGWFEFHSNTDQSLSYQPFVFNLSLSLSLSRLQTHHHQSIRLVRSLIYVLFHSPHSRIIIMYKFLKNQFNIPDRFVLRDNGVLYVKTRGKVNISSRSECT